MRQVEEKYKMSFPIDFTYFVTNIAGNVDISWSILSEDWYERCKELPFSRPDNGYLFWDINRYLDDDIYSYFENPRNLEVLQQKLYLCDVDNGDKIFFDLSCPKPQKPIVYYSHDSSYEGFPRLAQSFESYIDNLLKIGLVGNEFWTIEPFIDKEYGGINANCAAALQWRKLIGLV